MAADHPSEDRWEAFALGELSASDRAALTAHAARCDLCGKTVRALEELREGARLIDPGRRPRRTAWGAVGTLAAVAAAMVLFLHPAPRAPETFRSAGGVAEIEVALGALRWTAHAGATGYVVRVYRDTGELVDTVRTKETELRLPLPAGAYRFEVEAIDGTGVVARSRLTRFSLDR